MQGMRVELILSIENFSKFSTLKTKKNNSIFVSIMDSNGK